jgi:hypothetical protein
MWTLLWILSAHAEPEWISAPPKEDSTYKYYVGRAENIPTASEALALANKDAARQAVRNNFGFSYEFSSRSIEDSRTSDVSTYDREYVQRVNLQGFEFQDQHLEQQSRATSAYVLYRYKKDAIQKEQQRLNNAEATLPQDMVSTTGEDSLYLGGLNVETNPPGAKVMVDDEVYGKTPLKIRGQLQPGEHTITLDHPQRKTYQADIYISPGQNGLVQKNLEAAYGKLRFLNPPSGAQIKINNKFIGTTPLSANILAGTPLTIEIAHPQYYTAKIQNYVVQKDVDQTIDYTLTPLTPQQTTQTEDDEFKTNDFELPTLPKISLDGFFLIPRVLYHLDTPTNESSYRALSGALFGGDLGLWEYGGVSLYTGSLTKSSLSDDDTTFYDPTYSPLVLDFEAAKVTMFSAYVTLYTDSTVAYFLCYDRFQMEAEYSYTVVDLSGDATAPIPSDPLFAPQTAQGVSLRIVSRGTTKSWSLTLGFAGYDQNIYGVERGSVYMNLGFGLDVFHSINPME